MSFYTMSHVIGKIATGYKKLEVLVSHFYTFEEIAIMNGLVCQLGVSIC